jgi:Raf kinase inhibitor-like YbhB/YbcL family protein
MTICRIPVHEHATRIRDALWCCHAKNASHVTNKRIRAPGAPPATKSLAVTCYDPDASTGRGFWHWLVVNIPPNVTELALDAGNPRNPKLPPPALQTRTDFGTPGYGGPCPPAGDHPHRYLFTVFAVGVDSLPVNEDTSAAVIGFQLHFNTLAKGAIMGLYKR